MPPTTWPPRPAICLDCRTALPAGAPCPAGHSRIATFAGGGPGREELLTEVWGPASIRQQLRDAARAGVTSGGCGALFDGCGGCDLVGLDIGETLIVIVVLFALGALVWLLACGIGALFRWWRSRSEPNGATRRGAGPEYPTGRTGTVVAHAGLAPDPITGTPCVGFAALLEHRSRWWRRPATMLRDGATVGFDVVLDDGERVHIPPGALLVDLAAARAVRVDRLQLALYLGELDPARDREDELDPFPCHRTRAVQIRPGDRVEVLAAVEARPAGGAAAGRGGYRDQASAVLVPAGVPRLRPMTGE